MFKASAFEYRFRFAIHAILYALGFIAPWNYALHLDPEGANAHLWGALAADLSRLGLGNIAAAFDVLLILGILCALAAAWLRTWGAAYLGANVVESRHMHTAQAAPASGIIPAGIIEDGPFRHLRNPLYLGTFLHTFALALLMPVSGAIFTILTVGALQLRLILAEEPFLHARIGAPYAAYCALVPRLIPAPRALIAAGGLTPRWPQALLGELYFWGVALTFAAAGWGYETRPLIQGVLISLGLSLIVRAIVQKPIPA